MSMLDMIGAAMEVIKAASLAPAFPVSKATTLTSCYYWNWEGRGVVLLDTYIR